MDHVNTTPLKEIHGKRDKYLLVGVHAGKATGVALLAALASNVFDLAWWAVQEVTGVLVVGHFGILVVLFWWCYLTCLC